jgi:hypothetical protein
MNAEIRLPPRRIFLFLLACIGLLVVLHFVAVAAGLQVHDNPYAYRSIHLDSEVSVGTWFAQTLLFVVAILLALIGVAARSAGERWWKHWLGLAAVAVYASIDEGSALHEQATPVVRRVTGLSGGVFGPAWVLAGLAVGLVLVLVYRRFLVELPSRTRNLFLLGVGVSVTGGFGAEIVNVVYAADRTTHSYGYQSLAALEEALEKLGVAVVVYGLLDHMRRYGAPVTVRSAEARSDG